MQTIQWTDLRLSMKALLASGADPREVQLQRYRHFRGTAEAECVALEMLDLPNMSRLRARTALALTRDEAGVTQLAREADEVHGPRGVYIHQKALAPHVAARYEPDQWTPLRQGDGIKAQDVSTRRAFYVDFDPVRPRDVSATHDEREWAFKRAGEFVDVLLDVLGDEGPVGLGSSGNGFQVHIALADLPNDPETEALIKKFLAVAGQLCDDELVTVDQSVSDDAPGASVTPHAVCPVLPTWRLLLGSCPKPVLGLSHLNVARSCAGVVRSDLVGHSLTLALAPSVTKQEPFPPAALFCTAFVSTTRVVVSSTTIPSGCRPLYCTAMLANARGSGILQLHCRASSARRAASRIPIQMRRSYERRFREQRVRNAGVRGRRGVVVRHSVPRSKCAIARAARIHPARRQCPPVG